MRNTLIVAPKTGQRRIMNARSRDRYMEAGQNIAPLCNLELWGDRLGDTGRKIAKRLRLRGQNHLLPALRGNVAMQRDHRAICCGGQGRGQPQKAQPKNTSPKNTATNNTSPQTPPPPLLG